MDNLEPPHSFSFEGNVFQDWKLWPKQIKLYLIATEKDTESDKIKTSVLLTKRPGDEMRLASVLEKFSEYCNPRKNNAVLCHKFFTYRQHEGKNLHDFVTELKKLSSECEFETLHDSFIRDMIVCGTNDNSLRECP